MSLPSTTDIIDRRRIVSRKRLRGGLDAVAQANVDTATCRSEALALCRNVLDEGRAEIRRRLENNEQGARSGAFCLAETTHLIDQIIGALFDFARERVYAVPNPTQGEQLSLVAIGGYGRRELSPQSDIDLLFLLPYKKTAQAEQITEFLLYTLWDLGLRVGHAVRSVDDCIRRAKQDMTIRTTLLEMRRIAGEASLFEDLHARFDKEITADKARGFIDAKLAEREARHHKMGDSRYVLEPNIKDGKGGLRDLHTLFWIAQCVYRADSWQQLIGAGLIDSAEAERFERAQDFLWTVRCHLHALSGGAEDRLTFDVQPDMAARLGYNAHSGSSAVERFMKHYFLVAKEVGDLTRIFLSQLESEHGSTTLDRFASALTRRHVDGFIIERGRVNIAHEHQFRDNTLAMLRIFEVAHRRHADIHPEALRSLQARLKKIGPGLRNDPEANRIFLDLLTSERDSEPILRRMSEAGVLGRFVPDFGRVVAQMQFDMYHIYTTDEHTLRAVGMLHRLEQGELGETLPLAHRLMAKIGSRRALYVAVFLHDIAKGRGGDHSVKGAAIARKLGPRLGLSTEETETVAWLVRWHLAISHVAFRRDLEDPETVRKFVDLVQSPERLNLLTVLTSIDISAVGPGRWNNWKASLIEKLYDRAQEIMAGGLFSEKADRRLAVCHDAVRERLADWQPAEIERLFERFPTAYWLGFDRDTLGEHARLMRRADLEGRQITLDTRADAARGATQITVYTPDFQGLFSKLAGAIALAGGSILDARINTSIDGRALDVFWVTGADRGDFDRADRRAKLAVNIERTLFENIDPLERLAHEPMALPKRTRSLPAPPRIIVNNQLNSEYTVVEANGRDRPGLLCALTRAMADRGLRIGFAKISTFGEKIVDVFYVRDASGLKLEHPRQIERLHALLTEVLADGEASTEEQRRAA